MNTQDEKIPTADVIVVIDESGSMSCMGNEPVEALNKFINEQKQLTHDPDARISIYKFNDEVISVHKDTVLSELSKFSEYSPGGLTALWDAVGKAITDKLATDRSRNVVMMIITDGHNNSSNEFNHRKIRSLITRVEKEYGWSVHMLGANMDTAMEGATVGLRRENCGTYNQRQRGDLMSLVRTTSDACSAYRGCKYTGSNNK